MTRGFLWKFPYLAHYDFAPRSQGRIRLTAFGFWDKGKRLKDTISRCIPSLTEALIFDHSAMAPEATILRTHIWNYKKRREGASQVAPGARITTNSMLVRVPLQLWIEALT